MKTELEIYEKLKKMKKLIGRDLPFEIINRIEKEIEVLRWVIEGIEFEF